jgi:hypothetical protein
MTKIAYGRFVLVHSGHVKLFKTAEIVLVSNPGSGHCERLQKFWPDKLFVPVHGTVFKILANYSDIELILGQDNQYLGEQLLNAGVIDKLKLIPRNPEKSFSSTKIRQAFDQGLSVGQVYSKGAFNSYELCQYAYTRWLKGY